MKEFLDEYGGIMVEACMSTLCFPVIGILIEFVRAVYSVLLEVIG